MKCQLRLLFSASSAGRTTFTDRISGTGWTPPRWVSHTARPEGAESIVTLATIGPDGPTGQFIGRSGNLPW